MNDELNMAEALFKMQLDAADAVGRLEVDKTFKGLTLTFIEAGKRYDLTLSRSKAKP